MCVVIFVDVVKVMLPFLSFLTLMLGVTLIIDIFMEYLTSKKGTNIIVCHFYDYILIEGTFDLFFYLMAWGEILVC